MTELIRQLIGPGFLRDAQELEKLTTFEKDTQLLLQLARVKRQNKEDLARYIYQSSGIQVDPAAMLDVQIKRLHEYKRQLLNILHILCLYLRGKEDPGSLGSPRVFLFGAKASAGYTVAKKTIQLIVSVSELIASDPQLRDRLQVVFLEDYRVSLAEMIIPAADISEQISVAGKEASGTGNMKLMLNGAVTLGTLDGANVEILQAVGRDNILLFGMDSNQTQKLWHEGYDPKAWLTPELERVISMLRRGIQGRKFDDLADSLLTNRFGRADPYLILADFADYDEARIRAQRLYDDSDRFGAVSLRNIAMAGRFSADRAVENYGRLIWGLES